MTQFIIKYRWWIIGLSLAIGAGFGALIPFSETDPDIRNYVPATMPSRLETDRIESEFGVQDMVVILFTDSCILLPENLRRIRETDKAIARFEGVSNHMSPFTLRSIQGENGSLVAERLIGRIPTDSTGIRELRQRILDNRFAKDIVLSSDMTTASITATISGKIPEKSTLMRIDSVLSAHPGRAVAMTGGLPYIRRYILKDVRNDGLLLVPSALLIMLIILKLTLGEWKSVMMPFSVVVLSTLTSLGLITLFGWKLSVLTLLVPIILVAVANNYGIYLAARYQEISRRYPGISSRSVLEELLGSLNMPILFSGLTTIAGILGLLTHSVIPARQVGVLAATGVTIALIMSLLMIPGLISLRNSSPKPINEEKISSGNFRRVLQSLSILIINHPGKILLASLMLTLFTSSGVMFLKIDTNQENYFPASHPVRKVSNLINSRFGGSQTISVMVSGDIKSPEIMNGIDRLTSASEKIPGVGKVFSISQVVREMSKAIYSKGESGYDQIPSSGEAIAQMFELYNMSGDPDDFRQLMNLDNTRAHILIRLSEPSNEVIDRVSSVIDDMTAGIPASVTIGGYAIIMSDFAKSIIKGQVSSLLFALVTVFVLLAIIFRSLKGGLIASIPLGVSIIILFGFMGLAGIALDAATALLSSIMIGVGVDFTIQYLWCLNSFIRTGASYEEATRQAILTIGRSIIINAVSVMAGFSALLMSGFTSIRFFAYLVLISIGSCLIGAILIIPAFMLWFKPVFASRDSGWKRIRIIIPKKVIKTELNI